MRNIRLGRNGPEVSAVGLGLMGMAGGYGPADDAESIATIQAALDAGVTLLDAGDFYGHGHTELLLRDALKGRRRERAFIAIKFGAQRSADGKFLGDDGHPNSVKNFLAYSLKRLGTDYIDLYQPARLDPDVPIEDTIGAIAEMVKAGFVRHIGLSEVSVKTIRRAHSVHPIAELQIEYSLMSRERREGDFAHAPRTRHRAHGLRRSGARPDQRHRPRLANGRRDQKPPTAFCEGQFREESRAGRRRCRPSPRRKAAAPRSLPSPGWRRAAPTSCR